jgi:hypothetical protein
MLGGHIQIGCHNIEKKYIHIKSTDNIYLFYQIYFLVKQVHAPGVTQFIIWMLTWVEFRVCNWIMFALPQGIMEELTMKFLPMYKFISGFEI